MVERTTSTPRGDRRVRHERTRQHRDKFWLDNGAERNLGTLPGDIVVVGDIHGCWYTLESLISELGGTDGNIPDGITLVSVGDIHDKGRHSTKVLRWAMENVNAGKLVVVDSNHGRALHRRITNRKSPAKASVDATFRELAAEPDGESLLLAVDSFIKSRPVFARIAGGPTGEIVVAHAAATPRLFSSRRLTASEVRFHLLTREFQWFGDAICVVGHVRTPDPVRIPASGSGSLIRLDTGCAEPGGRLTAWLASEDRFISVPVDDRDLTGLASEDVCDDLDDDSDPVEFAEAEA